MTPDRCGFGRPLSSLHPGDRKAIEDFGAFLCGELAMDPVTGEYAAEPDGERFFLAGHMPDRKRQGE